MAHNKLYRNFIILQEDEKSHGISEEKPLSGYAKIEAKSDKCKISFYAQNLNKDDKYTIVLICYKKDLKQIVDLGSLEVTDVGKGEACKEYYINNIAGLDFSYEKISGAAICKYKDGDLSFLMYGFMNGENIKDGWKKCKVLKHADKDDKEFKMDISKVESILVKEKESKKENKEEYSDKKSKHIEKKDKDNDECENYPQDESKKLIEHDDEKKCLEQHEEEHMHHHDEGHMHKHEEEHMNYHDEDHIDKHEKEHVYHHEEEYMDKHEGEHMHYHGEDHMDKHEKEHMYHHEEKYMDKHEGEHIHKHEEDHMDDYEGKHKYQEQKYAYKHKDDDGYKEDYDYYGDEEYGAIGEKYEDRMENTSKFDQYENTIEKNKEKFELSGEIGKFFTDIMDGFEGYEPISKDIKYCKWYKIGVKSLDDMCNISNYNKYTVAYYPMLNYYPYIRKYGYFVIGYKCDSKGNLKYIVYGVPGKKDESEQPYAGKTGFVTWMKAGDQDEGCWLMFYDFRNSTIVVPMK